MKRITTFTKQGFLCFIASALLFVSSCNSTSDPIVPEPDLSVVEEDLEVNRAFEDLDNLTLALILSESDFGSRLGQIQDDPFCSDTEVILNEETGELSIDFGEGCTINGITRKGKIVFTSSRPLVLESLLIPGFSLSTTFVDYEVDGLKLKGVRTLRVQGFDIIGGSAQLGVEIRNGEVIWPDGTSVTFTSDQERSIELQENDYTVRVTGISRGNSREGFDYTSEITTPLSIKESCVETGILVPSLGVTQYNFRGIEVKIDYGFGDCDKIIEITYPGNVKEVILD